MGKKKKRVNRPLLQAKQVWDYLFGVTNEEREKSFSLAASAGLSIPGIYDQRTMSKEEKKKSRTYCKHNRHLSVCGQYRKRYNAKSFTAISPSQLFPGKYAGV